MAVHTRVVAKRAVCGRSQIATTANCNFLARARVIRSGVVRAQLDDRLSRARFLLARRVGRFPPRVSSWIASTDSPLAQLYWCSANSNWISFCFNERLLFRRFVPSIVIELWSEYLTLARQLVFGHLVNPRFTARLTISRRRNEPLGHGR